MNITFDPDGILDYRLSEYTKECIEENVGLPIKTIEKMSAEALDKHLGTPNSFTKPSAVDIEYHELLNPKENLGKKIENLILDAVKYFER